MGEWEAASSETTPATTSKTTQAGPLKRTNSTNLEDNKAATTSKGVKDPNASPKISPKKTYASRILEAKACLVKGKQNLGLSRNIKTDIKHTITETIERLYELVKEAENDIKKLNAGKTQKNLLE